MKRLKKLEDKNGEQLEAIKLDQGEKQLQILISKTDKKVDFKNVSFEDRLNSESKKMFNEIKEQNNKIDYT